MIARRIKPYLTTLTDLTLRYQERGAWSARLEKHDINSNIRATATPYTLKVDCRIIHQGNIFGVRLQKRYVKKKEAGESKKSQ